MAIDTYSALQTAVGNWLNRADLTSLIPDFIMLFETRMNRMLRVPQMETAATQSTVAGTTTYALPSDFLAMREVAVDANEDVILVAMTPSQLRGQYAAESAGKAKAYAIAGQDLVIAPVPSEAETLRIAYYEKIPALSDSNTTNWLLEDHPDAYLFGSLCMAEAYLKDDERVATWKGAWDEAMAEIRRDGIRRMTPATPLTMRSGIVE